ncbi:MAG: zf-HC2 domain-containing protein [Mobilitalea sp.]
MISLTCRKAQSMITPFINNKLSLEELEGFLEHVNSCKDCKEELEVYYALLTAMKQLDEDKNLSSDFVQELNVKLEKSQERIIHAKYTYYRKITVLIFTMILLAFLFSISYADISLQEPKEISEEEYHIIMDYNVQRDWMDRVEFREYLEEYERNKPINSVE